jgi:hypothetical protein
VEALFRTGEISSQPVQECSAEAIHSSQLYHYISIFFVRALLLSDSCPVELNLVGEDTKRQKCHKVKQQSNKAIKQGKEGRGRQAGRRVNLVKPSIKGGPS